MISIHAPREGSDLGQRLEISERYKFQSTLPAKGATYTPYHGVYRQSAFQSTLPAKGATKSPVPALRSLLISIHAPREGSDIYIPF